VLPSQLVGRGDTLDLDCANIAVAYELFVSENPGIKTNHGFTQDQLLDKIKQVRGK